jgi:hypothetical protein
MARRAGWNVERDRELRHLAQADRHIAEVNKRIARQRAIVQAAIDKGLRFQEAESLLHAFEAGRRALEKHRQLILDLLENAGRLPLKAVSPER